MQRYEIFSEKTKIARLIKIICKNIAEKFENQK
jgi:hypothetical protein